MMNFPTLPTYNHCCGCSACFSACPHDSIKMELDFEGFYYPNVDEKTCTKCLACEVACPTLPFLDFAPFDKVARKSRFPYSVDSNISQNSDFPKCFALKSRDKILRLKSSSGAAFGLLAEWVLAQGGVVFGASFDENLRVHHRFIESIDDLELLRRSKYVESEIGNSFIQARNFLKQGRFVLFSGVQCQIHGLNSFLKKRYENLFTIELICNSVPSVRIWEIYKQSLSDKIRAFNFRAKFFGWGSGSLKFETQSGGEIVPWADCSFIRGFLKHLITRPSCENCYSKGFKSGADMTLGDFWGIERAHKDFSDDVGVSCVIAHNKKALNAIDAIKSRAEIIDTSLEAITRGNPALFYSGKINKNRKKTIARVISLSEKKGAKVAMNVLKPNIFKRAKRRFKRHERIICDVAITTFTSFNSNYGQTLQEYALQAFLRDKYKLNTVVLNANDARFWARAKILKRAIYHKMGLLKERENIESTRNFAGFKAKYINEVETILQNPNVEARAFITGSDQVWGFKMNKKYRIDHLIYFALGFVAKRERSKENRLCAELWEREMAR